MNVNLKIDSKKLLIGFMQTKQWVIVFLLFLGINANSQTIVKSLSELVPYLSQDNVNVKMTPGTYQINGNNTGSFKLFQNPILLLFSGSNSTYDFTGVTFEISTIVFQYFGNNDVNEIQITGTNNVLKNLKMEDIGDFKPSKTALGIYLDGTGNTVEGFHMTIRGSYPYAYGDIFGKGSGYVIKHYKHAAILIKGNSNTVRNCTIIHRAYGHGIFCQGSEDTLIEGCYVEGEMRTTDAVLAEAGTGSAADQKDFMSVWGYKVPPGYMFSLQEDGIRAYNTGSYGDGERNTKNMTVRNCTVKNMRSGVTIGFCDGTKYVENCTSLGCEGGFWVGSGGQIVNCCGDAKYGDLYGNAYQTDKNDVVDLKVLDNTGAYGNDMIAYIGGSNHDITLRNSEANPNQQLKIMVCGIKKGLRDLDNDPTYNDFSSSSVKIRNQTNFPLVLASKSSNSTGESGGLITDSGTNNNITKITIPQVVLDKQNQAIYFPKQPDRIVTDADFSPGATSYSGLPVSYASSNSSVATIIDSKIHIVGSGVTTITALQAGDVNFNAAANVSQILTIKSGIVNGLADKMLKSPDKVDIYPNPVSDVLYIKLPDSNKAKAEIVSNNGVIIQSKDLDFRNNSLVVNRLNPGIYFIRITTNESVTEKKLIKF